MINAIQEALAPVGQTCVYNRADGFGDVMPTRECGPNGREPSMEIYYAYSNFHIRMFRRKHDCSCFGCRGGNV